VRRGALGIGTLAALQLTRAGQHALAGPGAAGPKPIAGGFSASFKRVAANPVGHVFRPLKGGELNTIGDFKGFVAATEIQGMAKGSDGSTYSFDCDMRFMHGAVGDPKKQHHDFERGIASSDLFWTVPVPPSAVPLRRGNR